MRITYISDASPIGLVVHDATEGLKGIIQGLEDHLTNEIEFTREKIVSSIYTLIYIKEMLGNLSDRVDALERPPAAA